jgi:iron(III) transport system substrate-binding protein
MSIRGLFPAILASLALVLQACGGSAQPASGQVGASPSSATSGASAQLTLKDIIDRANREGSVKVYWASTATEQNRQNIQDAMNKAYGTNITIEATASGGFTADGAKVISETSAGQPPSWDAMFITDSQYALFDKAGLLQPYDWVGLFKVPEQSVTLDGKAYAFSHQIILPAYNTKLIQPADAPKSWDDILDPKWQGKVGVSTATHHWGRLSQLWGDDKTAAFVTKLATQNPKLGSVPQTEQRLELGEILIAASNTTDQVLPAQRKGAPVDMVQTQPVVVASNLAAPLKGAQHYYAALLLSGFMATDAAQDLWTVVTGDPSIYRAGSPAQKMIEGKQYIVLTSDFLKNDMDGRTSKYGKLIGFR